MDKSEVMKSVEPYASAVKDYINPSQIILYGSYAKGTANSNSDIDVAVVVKKLNLDYLDVSKMLFKLRRNIDDRIEPVLIEEISDRSGFLNEIRSTGYTIFLDSQ
jgi:predicted nucleotidyltransferase